jgi:ClpP class serine protease
MRILENNTMKLTPNINTQLACDQSYYEAYASKAKELLAITDVNDFFDDEDSDIEDLDPFELLSRGRLSVVNGVAILRIEGFLSNHSSFMEVYYDHGTSYESTLWALKEIEEDEAVHTMLMLIDSGGGEVSGLSTVTTKIQSVAQGLSRSSFGFTDSVAASAAYAMLISNTAVLADEWATLGSIGVVQIFTTDNRRLDKAGIDVFVARSGSKKMKPSGIEPMDDETKEILTAEVDEIATLFFALVTNLRGTILGEDWKTGAAYLAGTAKKLNLIDATIDFNTIQERLLAP